MISVVLATLVAVNQQFALPVTDGHEPGTLAAPVFQAVDTVRYAVLNHGREAGEMLVIREGTSITVKYHHVDRNRGNRYEARYRLNAAGSLTAAELQTMALDLSSNGPTARYEVRSDSVFAAAAGGRGRAGGGRAGRGGAASPAAARLEPGMTFRLGGTPYDDALLARHLLRQPDRSARLFPSGRARADIVADTIVPTARGPRHVRFVMLAGFAPSPTGVWLDERDEYFADDVGWFMTIRRGDEAAMPIMRSIEIAWRNAQAEALAARLTKPAAGPIVIRNGSVFDSERGVMVPGTTVLIRGDRIVSVAPDGSVPVPAGAQVIDATGKSVLPGLWDMHTHFQLTSQSSGALSQLATGITTIRDLAADTDVAVSLRDRLNSGKLVGPRTILAGFIEGPGAWAGPSDALARTEQEARRLVAMYDSLGYRQIKLYNLVHPDLVPSISQEARARGLRLSGHVPRGMSVPAAVNLGFDEINHAAFLYSNFFQDSLYWPSMRAYSAVASAVAPAFDVDGPQMTALIEFLKARRTVIDGTFNLWMGAGTLQGQGNPGSAGYGRLLKRLYEAGVPIVAGTDNNAGTTFILELELYQHSGIPAPAVLQIATIGAARVMGDDREYGSIAEGKVADVIIVNGRPAERVSDLRNIDQVIRAGRLYHPGELRAAISRQP
jgi:hypothetical protein